YLEDLISAFKYVDVDFVTKDEQSEPHQYIEKVQNKYLTMYHRDVIDSNLEVKETNNGYNLDQSEIYKPSLYGQNNQQKKLSVIVQIHENCTYVANKCMRSLRHSSKFNKMETICVNDGSTYKETIARVDRV